MVIAGLVEHQRRFSSSSLG